MRESGLLCHDVMVSVEDEEVRSQHDEITRIMGSLKLGIFIFPIRRKAKKRREKKWEKKKKRKKEFGKDVAATAIIAGRIYAVAAVLLQSHYTQPLEYNAERTSNAK